MGRTGGSARWRGQAGKVEEWHVEQVGKRNGKSVQAWPGWGRRGAARTVEKRLGASAREGSVGHVDSPSRTSGVGVVREGSTEADPSVLLDLLPAGELELAVRAATVCS